MSETQDLLKALRDLTVSNRQQAQAIREQADAINYLAQSNVALIEALQVATQQAVDAQIELRDAQAEEEEEEQFEFLDQEPTVRRSN